MDQATLSTLTGWDWYVLLVTAGSVLFGLWRGLVRTVFGVGAWLVALVATPLAGPTLVEATGMQANPWVVFVVMFVALIVLVKMLGRLIARGLGKAGLGGADRGLGAVLGVLRALALILVVAVGAHVLKFDQSPAWREAHARPLLDALVQWAEPYLPRRISGIRET